MRAWAWARLLLEKTPDAEIPASEAELEDAVGDEVRAQRLRERDEHQRADHRAQMVPMPPMMQMRTICTEISMARTVPGSMKPM